MTKREQFIRTLKCEPIGGHVPTFELVFFLTMESLGKVHPTHRDYSQWYQMSLKERNLHINDIAQTFVDVGRKYDYSAILLQSIPGNFDCYQQCLERIREISGDEFFLLGLGDPTWAIPDGSHILEFSSQMYEEPEVLNDTSRRRVEETLEFAQKLDSHGHLLDGFAMCSDYSFNVSPFFSPEMFEELIVPYLLETIAEYRKMGYYSIKHSDGNIMPILRQIADCKPDAIHSLDPQGGVTIPGVREIVGKDVCLIGNVNCGLLQTGSDEEYRADVMRALREGMSNGRGYIFTTSNCAYTGLPLERYEGMLELWRKYGNYENYCENFG